MRNMQSTITAIDQTPSGFRVAASTFDCMGQPFTHSWFFTRYEWVRVARRAQEGNRR
ncbi:MAG: hypothetical protein IT405_01620 [Candidatus Yanofskybacteria bacterium]|nr:hypothetical protein [Candidatus Yanofskybacteria bacterium]